MTATPLNPTTTALLLLDLQNGFLQRLPPNNTVVENTSFALTTARQKGLRIAYIRAALDSDDISTVPTHNKTFSVFAASPQMAVAIHPDSPSTQIHSDLTLQPGDFTHRKVRYGSFMRGPSNALLDDFTENGIDTVVLAGVVTSGAVLSAVRQLADLDYRILVLEDCCADHDPEVHKMLCEKVFPSQATVIKSEELAGLF